LSVDAFFMGMRNPSSAWEEPAAGDPDVSGSGEAARPAQGLAASWLALLHGARRHPATQAGSLLPRGRSPANVPQRFFPTRKRQSCKTAPPRVCSLRCRGSLSQSAAGSQPRGSAVAPGAGGSLPSMSTPRFSKGRRWRQKVPQRVLGIFSRSFFSPISRAQSIFSFSRPIS
jgi:hypothetical protein